MFIVVIISMICISYFTKRKDPAAIAGLTLGTASKEQLAETRSAYNHWDIINSAVIIVLIIIFYLYFW